MRKCIIWTDEEKNYLSENYGNLNLDKSHFEKYFNRTFKAIHSKAYELGITRDTILSENTLKKSKDLLLSGLKKCKTCKEILTINNFYEDPKSRDKLFYSCKKCYNTYRKNNRDKNPLSEEQLEKKREKGRIYYSNNKERKSEYSKNNRKFNTRAYKNREFKSKYGISIDIYDNILENQGNSCAICKIHKSLFNYWLVVDHCHTTGKVRGILCRNCNLAIGYFKDNIESIKNSIIYIEKSKENGNC